MPSRKHILVLLVLGGTLLLFLEAVSVPPEDRPRAIMEREARAVRGGELSDAAARDGVTVRQAAIQQWNLAEYHFHRGEWADAEREYQRLIREFPYTDLDYGYRTDDARKRLEQIRILRTDSEGARFVNPNLPLSGD